MNKQLTKGIVLKFMRDSLKELERGSHNDLVTKALKKMVEAKIIDPPSRDDYYGFYNEISARNKILESLLTECYTYLIIQGIIIPEPSAPNFGAYDSWSRFMITEYGKKWAASDQELIPEDIEGFLDYIKNTILNIDDVVIQYVSEALETFDRRLIFASAVMIGAASEKILYLLAEAIKNSTTDPQDKKELFDRLEMRRLKALFDLVFAILDKSIKNNKIPYHIHEDSSHYLGPLFSAIRIQRNEAVHPIAGQVNPEQLRFLLLSFPYVCKKAYDFLEWLKNNKI